MTKTNESLPQTELAQSLRLLIGPGLGLLVLLTIETDRPSG
ncbi:MAG: hypothetical protein ACYTG5_21775 [Planctomycetota bacterium]|jgi:hypothetical protein